MSDLAPPFAWGITDAQTRARPLLCLWRRRHVRSALREGAKRLRPRKRLPPPFNPASPISPGTLVQPRHAKLGLSARGAQRLRSLVTSLMS
jgi:hypothetical protein